jgi:hypothetical protein
MPRLLSAIIASFGLISCGGELGQIGAGDLSVDLTNHCGETVRVLAVDDESDGFPDPIEVQTGESVYVSIVTFAGYSPERYLLLYQVEPTSSPTIVEFPVADLQKGPLEVALEADCRTLTRS